MSESDRRYERQIRTLLDDLDFLPKDRKTKLRGLTSGELDFGELLDTLGDVFGTYEENVEDNYGKTKDFVFGEKARIRAREKRGGDPTNAQGQKVPLGTECQSEEGLPPSISKGRLRGYVRYKFFPMDKKDPKSVAEAQRLAEISADDLSDESEGDLYIQVRQTYCKDLRQHGYGVWVKRTEFFERKSIKQASLRQAPSRGRKKTQRRLKGEKPLRSTFGQGGEVRGWTEYRGEARKNVDCPKCYAPKGFPCVTFEKADVVIYKPEMDESEIDMMEVRRFRTNEHRERVDAYLPSIGLMIVKQGRTNFIVPIEEVEVGEKTEEIQEDAVAEVTDTEAEKEEKPKEEKTLAQKRQWLFNRIDDEGLEEYEEAEDDGRLNNIDDEIAFLEERLSQKDLEAYNKWQGE
tara:strand:+ start:195 stop:1409 length:1215 start_codon:yes stop_codon:yes gene_type:complete